MKIKYLITASLLAASLVGGSAATSEMLRHNPSTSRIMITYNYDYAKAWAEVDELDHDNKLRQALSKVKEIRQNALKEKNYLQVSKAFIYVIDYTSRVEEGTDWQQELQMLISAANDAPDEPKAFLHLLVARCYHMYLDNNNYRIRNRTEVENDQSNDIATWSRERIQRAAAEYYRKAVANPAVTQQVPLDKWKDAVVSHGSHRNNNSPFCNTLFDFLAWAVIDEYCKTEWQANDFSYQHKELVSDANTFMSFQPNNEDTWSDENLRLSLYQQLLRAHQSDNTPTAYAFVDLLRLRYYKDKNVREDASGIYIKTLQDMISRYANDPEVSPAIAYYLASQYMMRGDLKKAHDIAAEAYKQFPKSTANYGAMCNSLARKLELKHLKMHVMSTVAIDKPFPMKIEYANMGKIYLHIYKISDLAAYNRQNYDRTEYIKKNLEEVRLVEIDLIDRKDYEDVNSEIIIEGLPKGNYVILGSNDKDYQHKKSDVITYVQVSVSNIAVVLQDAQYGHRRFYVLDRTSGQAIPSAKVQVYSKDKLSWEATTNKGGLADLDMKTLNAQYWHTDVVVSLPDGDKMEYNDYFYYNESQNEAHDVVTFFTDRKIYRPGQPLYYKIIVYNGNGKEAKVLPNYKTTIELLDVNFKVIARKDVTTNEFGSAHGEFTLPVGLANGSFKLREAKTDTRYSVNVEEYKRPTFEVKIDDPKGEVKINERITLHGSAATYAGVQIANAKVRYEVTRIPEWRGWWHWNFDYNETIIEVGETTTDDDGKYQVSFTARPDVNAKDTEFLVYQYRVKVDITDSNGETRSATTIASAGYRSLFLSINTPSGFNTIDKAKLNEVCVSCESANGDPLTANVTVKVSRLANFDKPRLAKNWKSCNNPLPSVTRDIWDSKLPNIEYSKADNCIDSLPVSQLIKTIQVHCNQGEGAVDLSFLQKEGSGHYLVELESKDSEGRPVTYQSRFTLYNPKESITKVNTPFFVDIEKASYEPGETAVLMFGSSLPELNVRYQILCGEQEIASGVKTLKQSVERIEVPIKEYMRGGLAVRMFYVKNNVFAAENQTINVPYSNKKLTAKFETFRDKLYPGDTEKWKIRITDYMQKPVRAEFAATLFDASIDALAENNWYLNAFRYNYSGFYFTSRNFEEQNLSGFIGDNNRAPYCETNLSHPSINWYGHMPCFGGSVLYNTMRKRAIVAEESSPMLLMMSEASAEEETMQAEAADTDALEKSSEPSQANGNEVDFDNAEIRTNFAETAFFQPEIVTDYNGDLFVEFTMPQSITRWKMLGLAHTKDMAIGTITNELVTTKDVSIIPNLPRFMRCGDKVEIPVKFSNMGDNDVVRGQVKMEVLDVATMRPLKDFKIWEPVQAFEVFKGKVESSKFVVDVPQYDKPVVIRIVGASGPHSDGEQHIVPILTDKTLVTEAMTLSVRGNETRTYEFKQWTSDTSSTAVDHSLTLEYSSNPAWYAVSSLPWLSQNPYDCYEQTFAKLFANSVSKLIVDNNPNISSMLAKWTEDNSQVLTSPLLKNQELKSVLIDETPWAIDGDNETDRMHKLCELLDASRIATENDKFIKKLSEGQMGNGAWPWFAGMQESPWITQHIVAGFGKLRHIGVDISKDPRISPMIDRAISYIDDEIAKYYDRYIKKDKSSPGYLGYQYLYMRSFFPEYKLTKSKDAYDYFLSYAQKHWQKLGLYYQAVMCTVFKRTGNEEVAQKIIASFQDRAKRTDEFGMYFNENINGYYWHENNIETQALIVEAFQEMGLKDEVEELKIWLIKNRQSNRWSTTKATTEACYAMFLCGSKIKADEPLCKIIIGGTPADTKDAEAGTGYFKQSWQAREMDKSMAKITVENPNPHISYGAVYRQYFEDLDKVRAADNKLQIEKKLYLNVKDNAGKTVLREVTPDVKIRPGDKVTARFVIRTDRDLEYVHLKDMRAAGFEPLNVISRTKYQDGMRYYESTKDASENFFIEHLNKGTYVFEYQLVAVHAGNFSNGIATIQCMYAPEFTAHSAGMRVQIVK
ncbi:MAG: hypothetical protein K6F33_01885 [Bacteroidales bacterium]|nr:hypothetical protein [Bacteroidales bacterium]